MRGLRGPPVHLRAGPQVRAEPHPGCAGHLPAGEMLSLGLANVPMHGRRQGYGLQLPQSAIGLCFVAHLRRGVRFPSIRPLSGSASAVIERAQSARVHDVGEPRRSPVGRRGSGGRGVRGTSPCERTALANLRLEAGRVDLALRLATPVASRRARSRSPSSDRGIRKLPLLSASALRSH